MSNIIKLTDRAGRSLLIDSNRIIIATIGCEWDSYHYRMNYYTDIILDANMEVISVKETPDEIYELINGSN